MKASLKSISFYRKYFSIFLLFIILGSLQFFAYTINSDNSLTRPSDNYTIKADSPIFIDDDTDFVSLGCPGSGLVNDPYIVQNYTFSGESIALQIAWTTMHFVVRNCTFISNSARGIYIQNVGVGTATVENCTFVSNSIGLFFDASSYSISKNNYYENNGAGLIFRDAYNFVVFNNTFIGNERGFNVIEDSYNSYIINNTFTDDGIIISEHSVEKYSRYTLVNNLINGKPFGFFFNLHNTTISNSNYGQYLFVNCSELTISDLDISNTSIGLYFAYCNNSKIDSCSIDSCYNGVWSMYSSSLDFFNNRIKNSITQGCYFVHLSESDLSYNSFEFNIGYAIHAYLFTGNNTIHHNNFIGNNPFLGAQAVDEGINNTWYDRTVDEGNHWSDWISGNYTLDGTSGSEDPYPFANPLAPVISEFPKNLILSFIFSLLIISLAYVCNLYRKKKHF